MHVGRNNQEYEYTMRGQKLEKTQCEKTAARAMTVLNQLRRNVHYRN